MSSEWRMVYIFVTTFSLPKFPKITFSSLFQSFHNHLSWGQKKRHNNEKIEQIPANGSSSS